MPSIRRLRRPACLAALLPLVLLALAAAPPAAAEVVAVGEPFPLAPDDPGGGAVDLAWLPPGPGVDQPAGFLAAWATDDAGEETIFRAFVPEDPVASPLARVVVAGPGEFGAPHVETARDRRSAIVFANAEPPACYGGFLYGAALDTQAALQPAAEIPCVQTPLQAALLPDGRLVVVYERARDFHWVELYGELFSADGQPLGDPFPISQEVELIRVREVAAVPGGFLVFSIDSEQSRFNQLAASVLRVQRFTAEGEPLSALIELASSDSHIGELEVVPVSGGFVAVWTEARLIPGEGTTIGRRLFARRLDALGAPAGPVQELEAELDERDLGAVAAAPGPGDTVLLAWFEATFPGPHLPGVPPEILWELRARLFTADLAPAGEEATVAATVSGVSSLALAAGPAGDALAAWSAGGQLDAQRLVVETACTPSETVLCLQGGRFAVTVDWADFQGNAGPGRRVPVASDDSGLFWFFDPANWEMLVKVIDGCPVNGHFWVFAAAATNVEYTLTVSDLVAHETRVFRNDLGDTARALTATAAFPTCGAGGG